MPITLHCESCKKKIKAPDDAGGKWGNCPYCKHKNYIPLPKNDDEPELRLIPLDASEETRFNELMDETKNLTQNILKQNAAIDDGPDSGSNSRTVEEKEVIKKCVLYLRQMADGSLGPAEKTLTELKKNKKNALRVLSAMARSDKPEPELIDVSEGVLQGLIRDASGKLS